MSEKEMIYGPTFDEMRDPRKIRSDIREKALEAQKSDPMNPINLYNINWWLPNNTIHHFVMPKELTNVDANIILMSGNHYPTGAHKVGAVYSILMEKQLWKEVTPGVDTIVCPSTGNYGIGGAWVGPRMGYDSLVVLPEEMSAERFEMIRGFGAEVIATPGCESNVKEIFDKVWELRRDPKNKILEQFSEFGNYRFHYGVTGDAVCRVTRENNIGNGKVAAFVSAMGSAGTIAAGDYVKQQHSEAKIVGVEPIQCPTMYNVGFGGHRIEGIGDKHVTWVHNVLNMDYLMCIDDMECLRGLQLIQEGAQHLVEELGISESIAMNLVDQLGISAICNLLGAIKTAKHLELGPEDNVITIGTDSFDRYPSVMRWLASAEAPMSREVALKNMSIFTDVKMDYIQEGSPSTRKRWHNQKYFTWVEQQGKTVEQLREQEDPRFWEKHQNRIEEINEKQKEARGF